jgi:hypothetical protein
VHYIELVERYAYRSMPMTLLRHCSYSPREVLCNECMIIENVEFDALLSPFTLLGHGQRYKIMSKNYKSKTY